MCFPGCYFITTDYYNSSSKVPSLLFTYLCNLSLIGRIKWWWCMNWKKGERTYVRSVQIDCMMNRVKGKNVYTPGSPLIGKLQTDYNLNLSSTCLITSYPSLFFVPFLPNYFIHSIPHYVCRYIIIIILFLTISCWQEHAMWRLNKKVRCVVIAVAANK